MAVSADTMSVEQAARAFELYRTASAALRALAEEPLNLSFGSRAELLAARGALESFDYCRMRQPKEGGRP